MVRSNYILHLFEMTMRTKPEFQNCQMKKINVKCVSGWENDVMLHVLDVIEAVWLPCGGDLFSLQIKWSFFWWGSTFWEAWRSKTFIFAEVAKVVFVIVVVLLWHWPVEVGLLYASCMAWRFFFPVRAFRWRCVHVMGIAYRGCYLTHGLTEKRGKDEGQTGAASTAAPVSWNPPHFGLLQTGLTGWCNYCKSKLLMTKTEAL